MRRDGKRRVPQEGRGTYARPYAVDPAATMRERSHDARGGKRKGDGIPYYFFPASMASPFLHATILIFGADTISFDSILNVGFFTMNVHTSSQRRYVCKWPCTPDQDYKYEGRGREGGNDVCEPRGSARNETHTFSVVFVFTCFTMMSARDLSNCRTATRWRHIVSRVGRSASLRVGWNHTHLLQDLHR